MELLSVYQKKKEIYSHILNFIDNIHNSNDDFQVLANIFTKNNISQNQEELINIFSCIISIIKNHRRHPCFFKNICNIILYFSTDIPKIFSKETLFEQFKDIPQVLTFLLQNKILIFDQDIFHKRFENSNSKDHQYKITLYPGYRDFLRKKSKRKAIENTISKIDPNLLSTIDEKVQIGENDSYICTIIRQDAIQDFVCYINLTNKPFNSFIPFSLFESNSILRKKGKITMIQYAAFQGSLKILQYMSQKEAEFDQSLWIFGIHSNNAKILHFLENHQVPLPKGGYETCLIEAVKCHHNDIVRYIENNFILKESENIFWYSHKYQNWSHFPDNIDTFFSEIKHKDGLYYCLNFSEIVIPPSVTTIGKYTFKGFANLRSISIPSNVTKIKRSAFEGCTSLNKISLHSSSISASYKSFYGPMNVQFYNDKNCIPKKFFLASTINQIEIASPITMILDYAFNRCESLKQITLPSSLIDICVGAFSECSSLEIISIPSSVEKIGSHSFLNCKLLKKVTIPSSSRLKMIGKYAFNNSFNCHIDKKIGIF